MNFHLRPYNQYILNIVTNIYLGLDFNDYKNLDLFVLSMTNVLNSRPTEMVISLKESFSKEFIIIGLPSHLLMLPVSLLFFLDFFWNEE